MSEHVRRLYDEFTTRVCKISFGKRFARQNRIARPGDRSRVVSKSTRHPAFNETVTTNDASSLPPPSPLKSRDSTALLNAVLIAPLLISALGHAHCSTRSIVVHARTHTSRQIMRPPTNQSIRRHLFDCSLTSA